MTNDNIIFENDFQQKIMTMGFKAPVVLKTKADVLQWRSAWTAALKTWHSPYKALIDCTNLVVEPSDPVKDELDRMLRFFQGFFLKKAVGYGLDVAKGHESLPFPVLADLDAAAAEIGVRNPRQPAAPSDFRANIQLANHFQQHVMELSFATPIVIATKEQVATLKSKIVNNLMQWHSRWSLLVDCTNLEIAPDVKDEFAALEKYFKGFFLKQVLGYSPKGPKETYPFPVYRARHAAAGRLESEGNFSGDDANCSTRKA